jgi:hypothetical protein
MPSAATMNERPGGRTTMTNRPVRRGLRRVAVVVGASTIALVGILVGPALAAAPVAKTCTSGEQINGGHFSSLLANGVACSASQVRVEYGILSINPGAFLTVDSSTFASSVFVHHGGIYVRSTTIREARDNPGGVIPTTAGSIWITSSAVYGDILDDNEEYWGQAGSFILRDSVVTPGTAGSTGSVHMEGLTTVARQTVDGSRIDGHLSLRGAGTTVEYTHVGHGADISFARSVEMCSVQIVGDLQIENTAGATDLGGFADASRACGAGIALRVNGDLTLANNVGPVNLKHVVVTGNLNCTGNATKPILGDVTVTGARLGQCG